MALWGGVAVATGPLWVALQCVAVVEAAGAEQAGDGLCDGDVLAAVRDEVGALAEGLPAHPAHMGLLS